MSEKSIKDKQYYAHSVEGRPPEEWHRLEDHLKNVAEMARKFANDFNAGDWGCTAGLLKQLKRQRKGGGLFMNEYQVTLEVAGPAAMFTRPDTGSTPISYPVPTFSAAKGMFEAVVWLPHVYIQPTKVEVCSPIQFQRYVTNYGGPLRKQDQIKKKVSYQLIATILVDVCYRIYGEVHVKKTSSRGKDDPRWRKRRGTKDYYEIVRDQFNERLEKGQTYYTPCLGWKEFVPNYFGPLREETKRERSIDDIVIPSFLRLMWEHRQLKPEYVQDWRIVKGVLSYLHQTPTEEELNAE